MLTETHCTVNGLTCLHNSGLPLYYSTPAKNVAQKIVQLLHVHGGVVRLTPTNNDRSPFHTVEAQPQLHSPLAAPGEVGGENWAADKGTLCAGERSAQEPALSPVVVRGCADRGPRGEEEHFNDADGKGDAGVSQLRHPLV